MHALTLHPDCSPGPVTSVIADITPTPNGCEVRFVLHGDIARIHVPEDATPVREDDLWKRTCAEIFWQPVGGSYYREFNLSPSRKWAAYDFSDFRKDACDAPADGVEITCESTPNRLELAATIASELPLPAVVALNMIVEDEGGQLTNWALAFADGPCEFHSEVCRAIELGDRS